VARSASRLRCVAVATGTLALAVPLAGCTTTEHEAQRVQLDSARLRAALKSTRVTVANATVAPTSVATVTAGSRTAFIITVRNAGHRAVSDLPISVGYERADGSRAFLNASVNLNYFQAHLPMIAAGRSLTWVYTVSSHALPPRARLFAMVGRRPTPPALLTETNVRIHLDVGHVTATNSVTVRLENPSSTPQYQLQVYAYARQGSRYVAAGNLTVADLGAGSRQRVKVPLVGVVPSANLHVVAIPTILQ
jgi:hypothetical protein